MEKDNIKLPKQWKHWCDKVGLQSTCRTTHKFGGYDKYYYLKGKGRHWRVTCHGDFQASNLYEDFDRWANSVKCTFTVPARYSEFEKIVESV